MIASIFHHRLKRKDQKEVPALRAPIKFEVCRPRVCCSGIRRPGIRRPETGYPEGAGRQAGRQAERNVRNSLWQLQNAPWLGPFPLKKTSNK